MVFVTIAPEMIYAIGDIHGHLDQLLAAHALIAEDRSRTGDPDGPILHLGDLVDRGPEAKGVIQYLIDGIEAGEDWLVICGNHDRLFSDFLKGGDGTHPRLRKGLNWHHERMGGKDTLASYGVRRKLIERDSAFRERAREKVPEAHREFLTNLPLWHREDDIIFVHAGIRPGFPMDAQDEDDLMWIRDEFLWHVNDHEALIVHGHTPVDEPTHYGNRVNVDTGAGWGNDLIPVVCDGGDWFALTKDGREKLKVPRR